MSHIKAWHIVYPCRSTHWNAPTFCPIPPSEHYLCVRDACEIAEVRDFYINERGRKVIDGSCEYIGCESRYLERDYKSVEAEPHDGTWDGNVGCWDLKAGRATYLCEYLEIDGKVVCDEREVEPCKK